MLDYTIEKLNDTRRKLLVQAYTTVFYGNGELP